MLFEESGISPDVAKERGYYTARRRSEVPEVFRDYQRKPGLVVPMFSPDGETAGYQLRPDRPRKGGPKYEAPGGISPVVDVHPRMLEEARSGDGPVLITEGAKTGDAATSRGIATVVLAGVWMWCVPKAKPYRLKPCFDHIRLEGREVMVAFDSDCMTKAGVQEALTALVAALKDRGAAVKVIYLPDAEDGTKQGVDDYLAGESGGTVREMFMLAREFDPADVGRIRMSRDEKLRAAVEDLERRFWSTEWKGVGGASARDVYLKLIEAAARSGKVHPDGLRVKKAQGPLALESKVSARTLWRSLNRLEETGLIYRDNKGRKPDKSGAFVLKASSKATRAKVSNKGRRDADERKATPELQTCDRGDLPLRAPRLPWSRPKSTPKRGLVSDTRKVRQSPKLEPWDRIERLGKIRGAILDALDAAGGTLTVPEIAETLHRSRPRDIRRRNLPMLEEAGIVAIDGDTVSLTPDWLDRLEEQRKLGKEIEAEELARERYKIKSRGYHRRHETPKSRPSAEGLANVRASRAKRRAYLADPVADTPSDAELVLRHRRVRQLIREGMAPRFAEQAVSGCATVGRQGKHKPHVNNVNKSKRESSVGNANTYAPRKLPPKKDGIYVHGAECDCWLCDEEGVA
jgi:predicted transcriptional regulator